MEFEKSSQTGPTSQRRDTSRKIIRRGKNYTFRNRAVEEYLASGWPDVAPG